MLHPNPQFVSPPPFIVWLAPRCPGWVLHTSCQEQAS